MSPFTLRLALAVNKIKTFMPTNLVALQSKFKGGRLEKYSAYWQGVYKDYQDVFVEVLTDAKSRPLRFTAICAGLCGLIYAIHENPDEQSFRDRLILSSNRLLLTSPTLRNPATTRHLIYLTRCYNEGLIRRFSFGLFSVLWMDNYDRACDIYSSQCSYLQPRYATFHRRIVDIGFLGRWHILKRQVVDYDVNPSEWGEHVLNPIAAVADSYPSIAEGPGEPHVTSSITAAVLGGGFLEKLKRVTSFGFQTS